MLREHLCESVYRQTHVSVLLAQTLRLLLGDWVQQRQPRRGLNVVAHAQHARRLSRNEQVVASDHLHGHAEVVGVLDGLLGVWAGRVQESQQS